MTLVLLIALLVVVLASATAVTLTRRRRGPELEPPPLRPAPPAVPPPDAATSPTPAAPERELTPEQVAEIERALAEAEAIPEEVAEPEPEAIPEAPTRLKPSFRDRLGKARTLFSSYLGSVRSREKITDETWDDLEEALILADVGMETTTALLDDLRGKVKAESISSPDSLVDALKADLVSRLAGNRVLAFE
ncbi:MAG: fused signal recognition particle receptor, partial [Acidimicrobiaceae bacterium]|nr:fused signal recognition particle receptor [Acidimicrobiaceae bacterium]